MFGENMRRLLCFKFSLSCIWSQSRASSMFLLTSLSHLRWCGSWSAAPLIPQKTIALTSTRWFTVLKPDFFFFKFARHSTHAHTLLHIWVYRDSFMQSRMRAASQACLFNYPNNETWWRAADLLFLQATFRSTEICAPLQMRDGGCRHHVI